MLALQPTAGGATSLPPESGGRAHRCLTFLLFLAAVVFPCAVLYRVAAPIAALPSFFGRWDSSSPSAMISTVDTDSEDARLEKVLKEAAMEDKTVILTTLNAAWSSPGSVIDLFIESFQLGDGTREKHFMSAGYLEMMWRRIEFLRVVLGKGYNFISRMQISCGSGIHYHIFIQMEIFR